MLTKETQIHDVIVEDDPTKFPVTFSFHGNLEHGWNMMVLSEGHPPQAIAVNLSKGTIKGLLWALTRCDEG